jgi:hypothetical protein
LSFDRLGDLTGLVALTAVLAGLAVRRLYRLCWTFVAYAIVVFLGDLVPLLWPSLFTWDFFFAKEATLAALKLLLAVELYLRLFAGLPGVRRNANALFLLPLLLTLALISLRKSFPS